MSREIFNKIPDTALGQHNVAGVLRATSQETLNYVEGIYGLRCGHIPNGREIGVLVGNASPETKAQMAYLSDLFGRKINVLTPDDLNRDARSTLVAPYIHSPQAESQLKGMGVETWGLQSRLVDAVKNKANCHQLITDADLENFSTPEYIVAPLENLPTSASRFLREIENLYSKTGMTSSYPVGIMIRAAESDGNYGGCAIKQEGNQVKFLPDGNSRKAKLLNSWEEALAEAQTYLRGTTEEQVEDRLVISRLINLADSPGLSVFINNNEVTSLGWNGQVVEKGSTACIGTSSYQPQNEYLRSMKDVYEEETARGFENFLRIVSDKLNIDFVTISGFINTDLMIPGELEVELQKRLGKKAKITIAEINPRFTNYTDALLLSLWVEQQRQTVENLLNMIKAQVLTIDKYPIEIPAGIDISQIREEIYWLDQKLQTEGSRLILRMPALPQIGVVFIGDFERAKNELDNLIRKYQHE